MSKQLLNCGIITEIEFQIFKEKLIEKYHPLLSQYTEIKLDK